MFKRTLHILLALLILINGMGYSVIQADFYIYQDKIAALFCINKDKPELACDGKCELERRLDEAQETEENKRRAVQEEVTWLYLKPEVKAALTQFWKHYHPVFGVLDEKPEILLSIKDFFHPPQACFFSKKAEDLSATLPVFLRQLLSISLLRENPCLLLSNSKGFHHENIYHFYSKTRSTDRA